MGRVIRGGMERHRTILKAEVLEFLAVKAGGTYLDATFGEGGHAESILEKGGDVVGLDRDTETLDRYRQTGEQRLNPHLRLVHGTMSGVGRNPGIPLLEGAIADLGVSTRQILSTDRGFSFQAPGPLDMRMDLTQTRTLADILGSISERDLADALFRLGEVRSSRRIASQLLTGFHKGTIQTTADLLPLVSFSPTNRHPATQLFMALRMMVNEELSEIETGIPEIFEKLKPGSRLCVITFHSVEDRVVKRLFKVLSGQCICESSHCYCPRDKRATILTKKPMLPGDEEDTWKKCCTISS